jgi:hypothetical protein
MSSESPKWIALVLSILAITISGLSWWESHRGRVINEAVSRPVLSVKAEVVQATYDSDRVQVSLNVKLKNDGKAAALLTGGAVEPVLKFRDCDTQLLEQDAFAGEILPGQERRFESRLSLKSEACKNRPWLDVTLNVSYKDSGSGTEYSQTFQWTMKLMEISDLSMPTETPTPSPR